MAKLFINDVEYIISDSFQITELSNEELNSGILKIPHSQKLNVEMLDKIKIIFSQNDLDYTFYYLAGTLSEEQIKFSEIESERKYNYLINLLSPTILLENYITPNRTITQYVDKINKTIYYYLKSYIETYAPDLIISDELKTLTETVVALEDQFPNLNLREIFNKLLAPLGCVISMKDFETLTYIDLNAKGKAIDINKIKILRTEKKFEEYASHLKVNAENVIANDIDCLERNIVPKSNTGVVSDENAEIILRNPIYLIDKIYVYPFINGDVSFTESSTIVTFSFNEAVKIDITDFIIENSIYQTKLVGGEGIKTDDNLYVDFEEMKKYKINFLTFTQNSNTISGLTYNEKLLLFTKYAYEQVIKLGLIKEILNANSERNLKWSYENISISSVRDLIFDIKYKTINSLNLEFEKDNYYKNVRKFIDSQQSSYLNIDRFGKSEKEKINRIGNPEKSIGGRFKNFEDIPNLNDYLDDYTLIQRTLVFYNSEILMQGYICKDFVRKNVSQSLNQQLRFTQIDTTNNAVLRNENTRIVLELSDEPNAYGESNLFNLIYFLNSNYGKSNEDVVFAYKTIDKNNVEYGLFNTKPSLKRMNNSIVINFATQSNFSFANRISGSNYTGGYGVSQVPYVDEDGEFVKSNFYIFTKEYIDPIVNRGLAQGDANLDPLLDVTLLTEVYRKENLIRYKDNREIMAETIQIDFNSKSNIFIKEAYLNYLKLINFNEVLKEIQIYASLNQTYTKETNTLLGNQLTEAIISFNNNEIKIEGVDLTLYKSFAIGFGDELLIGVNNNFENTNTLYFNIIKY